MIVRRTDCWKLVACSIDGMERVRTLMGVDRILYFFQDALAIPESRRAEASSCKSYKEVVQRQCNANGYS